MPVDEDPKLYFVIHVHSNVISNAYDDAHYKRDQPCFFIFINLFISDAV